MSVTKKDLHIVYRFADRVLLNSKIFDLDNIELIKLVDNLSIGPVCNLETIDGVYSRKDWLDNIIVDIKYKEEIISAVDEDVTTISKISELADMCENVYIWTGYDASELIGTARVLKKMMKLKKSIYVLDFSNIQVQNINGETISPKSLLQTAPSQIKDVIKYFKLQESADLKKWEEMLIDVESSNSLLRILDINGLISHKRDSYYDKLLLSKCIEEYQNASVVIGQALVDVDISVGDYFLNWRIKELVKEKKLESCGQLSDIRDYSVKITNRYL